MAGRIVDNPERTNPISPDQERRLVAQGLPLPPPPPPENTTAPNAARDFGVGGVVNISA